MADRAAFAAKLNRFATSGGTKKLHVIFDFDRTLTIKRPNTDDEVTTWHILREHLPANGKRAYQELFEKYRALEVSGEMSQQNAVDWWSAILNLFVEHKVNLNNVEETFLERASIRPGATALFELLAQHDIPTIILSAGIREVIEMWCRKYNIQPSLIISTSLLLNDRNEISGWQKDTLVHVLNKSEATHDELSAIRTNRPNALLVGDSLDDAAMATGNDDVIRIRLLDPRADEASNAQEERKTFDKFDAYIQTGTLQPLIGVVKRLT